LGVYDERLAERVRAALSAHAGVSERRMMGGVVFMVDGKMACGVNGDELWVRVGKPALAAALARPHTRPMDFTGRPSSNMVYVAPAGLGGAALDAWVAHGVEYARAAEPSRTRRGR
jgi:TfoX/Sxy family transcriptional regulator of competence genes